MNTLTLVLSGWGVVAVFFFLAWILAYKQRNAGWVDVGWSLSLVILVGWYGLFTEGVAWRRAFYFILAAIWGLRLFYYIFRRLLKEGVEEGRYAYLRSHWGKSADWKFIFFFQGQGLANVILTGPILLLMHASEPRFTIFDFLGALIILVAVVGETIADRQLLNWRMNPENKGKTCRNGLWAISRHPNYFFEWTHWLAYPVLGLVLMGSGLAMWWPFTLLGPVMMYILLMRYTGIPYTEQQALRSRGEDYRKYQAEVPEFFPFKNFFKGAE